MCTELNRLGEVEGLGRQQVEVMKSNKAASRGRQSSERGQSLV